MPVDQAASVGELATSLPGALRAFDDLRIDYCCSGTRSLADACRAEGVAVGDVVARIEQAAEVAPVVDAVWLFRPLAALVAHIVSHYHAFTRKELARLRSLVAELQESGDTRWPELRKLATLLAELENEMIPHMVKEERILFPYVIELEARARSGNPRPHIDLQANENPLRVMMQEHRHADGTLRQIRRACADFVTPEGATPAIADLYDSLERLERTLHHHVHLESNVLFRRAIELERG
jgi:regulator of cell morphogenesis and NO signaling